MLSSYLMSPDDTRKSFVDESLRSKPHVDVFSTEAYVTYSGSISNPSASRGKRWHIYFGNKKFDHPMIQGCIENKECLYMNQVHGPQIFEASQQKPITCDGLTTKSKLYALALKTADCLPVMIVHDDRLFAVHAGWRGVVDNILFSTKKFSLFNSKTLAFIGPHIQFRSFEVGKEVVDAVLSSLSKENMTFEPDLLLAPHSDGAKSFLNLSYAVKLQLLKLGVFESNIFISDIDTLTDPSWHSYRRDSFAAGRNIHLIFKS